MKLVRQKPCSGGGLPGTEPAGSHRCVGWPGEPGAQVQTRSGTGRHSEDRSRAATRKSRRKKTWFSEEQHQKTWKKPDEQLGQRVGAPTLWILGGDDEDESGWRGLDDLRLEVVPGGLIAQWSGIFHADGQRVQRNFIMHGWAGIKDRLGRGRCLLFFTDVYYGGNYWAFFYTFG